MAKPTTRKKSAGITQYDLFRAMPVPVSPLAKTASASPVLPSGTDKRYLSGEVVVPLVATEETSGYVKDRDNGLKQARYRLGDVVYAPYLDTLNPPQREAVEYGQGPLLVIAGAGSGKTRVLTYRIAQLIARGVPPHRILALTFTNKAAREMRDRIEAAVGVEMAKTIWMGTFHSVFSRCIRKNADIMGFSKSFSVYDPDSAKKLLRDILKGLNLNYEVKDVASRISFLKNECISSDEYLHRKDLHEHDERHSMEQFHRVYSAYTVQMKNNGAMDFDDLLFLMYKLMDEPGYRADRDQFETYWDYILVDEFQDTNTLQLEILRRLSERTQNLTVVGDDAQSIYAFRGAKIQNILRFDRSFGETAVKVVKLEQNYRSTEPIVNASNRLIAYNTRQMVKRVFTTMRDDRPIEYLNCDDEGREAAVAASEILRHKEMEDWNWRDFAILYRTKAQARPIEYMLRKYNIPYRIVGGTSFFDRQEIRDLLAYLRFVNNLDDREALKRCLLRPKRNVGDKGVGKLLHATRKHSIRDVLLYPQHFLTGFNQLAMEGLLGFTSLIDKFLGYSQTLDAFQCVSRIVEESGLRAFYEAEDKKRQGAENAGTLVRVNNLNEFLAGVRSFVGVTDESDSPESDSPRPGTYLSDYLAYISLVLNPNDEIENENTVTLMTIHASKGLEFSHVHVVGMEEGLFPSARFGPGEEEEDEEVVKVIKPGEVQIDQFQIEEERRLCYVAVTRARTRLLLTGCASRDFRGKPQRMEPSRFLDELAVEDPSEEIDDYEP